MRATRLARRGAALLIVTIGLAVVPACHVNVNCPDVSPEPWWGSVDSQGVQFTGPQAQTVDATVFRPDDTARFPGRRPVVVVAHGYDEDECHQWWTAWSLAGHGYVTVVPTNVPGTDQVGNVEHAINWALSSDNPYRDMTDPDRLGLVGHSAGAAAVQVVQAVDRRVKAFVALDNLRMTSYGCPDEIGAPSGGGAIVLPPRTPGLGLARDSDCSLRPATGSPEFPTPGVEYQQSAGVPTAELSLAGSAHLDYETAGPDHLHYAAFYVMSSWLDDWVAGDATALRRITDPVWAGYARPAFLSTYYRSAISVPGYTCFDLRHACSADQGSGAGTAARASAPTVPTDPGPVGLDAPHPIAPAGSSYGSDLDYATGQPTPAP